MPPAELPHRVRERARQEQDRRGWFSPPGLPEEVAAAPLPSWPFPLDPPEEGLGQLEKDVDALLGGGWSLLGVPWPAGGRSAWHHDPVAGTSWPADEPAFSIDYRHGHADKDIKLCWELQKLQLQAILAMGSRLLGAEAAGQACRADLQSWLEQNRPFMGIGYASNIETAIRTVSLLLITGLLGPDSFSPYWKRQIWMNLHWNAVWLRRYPSLYSSAANHRTGELTGLLVLESVAPGLPGADWRSRLRELQQVAERQFHPDGVGKEQSVHYQAFTTEHLLIAHQFAAFAGENSGMLPMLERSASFFRSLMDSAGNLPQIGDGDESSVIRQSLPAESLPYSVCGAVAGLCGRADLAPPGWQRDLRCLVLGIPGVRPAASPVRSRSFRDGGYTVLRRGDCVLTLDHGPLGFPGTAGHGHADALSACMHYRGEPVWVDWGTYRYNGAPAWREWARSTPAHNTVTVGGRSQSTVSGPFNWTGQAEARLLVADLGENRVSAEHDGYMESQGVVHRREILLSENGLLVTDSLAGEGRRPIEACLHLAPGWTAARDGQDWIISKDGSPAARLAFSGAPLDGEAIVDGSRPGPGSHSREYNTVEASTSLRWKGTVGLPAEWRMQWEWLGDWRDGIEGQQRGWNA